MRFHVPSYLIPGTWLENLRNAESLEWISGVELLFFRYDREARELLDRDCVGMAAYAGRFLITVHLPDILGPEDEPLIAATRSFASSYVIHPPRDFGRLEAWAQLVTSWRSRFGKVFYLENSDSPWFAAAEALLPDIELCADCGRLLLDRESPFTWITERRTRVRELHLHEVWGGRDHAPLREGEGWLAELAPLAAGFPGPCELEVFSLKGAEESRRVLESVLARSEGVSA